MTAIRIAIGSWDELGAQAGPVRETVFVHEQHVPLELEWDEHDAVSLHALALDAQGRALGTGRLLPDGHIGRMAVLKEVRAAGVGGRILQALIERARALGYAQVLLNAQVQVEGFYSRYGFTREGEEFMEAGIPHIAMRRVLSPPQPTG
jgi:predicted GNAT family N-acyltransferase